MSRIENDAYYTPDSVATELVGRIWADGFWHGRHGGQVLEPHAGGGAFVRALVDMLPVPARILAVDIDMAAIARLQDARSRDERLGCVDTLTGDSLAATGAFDLIIGNPPFCEAEAHIRKALSLRSERGVVAFLLRLAILESTKRAKLWAEFPASHVYVLSRRPSFTGGKTDSCAYGFFVWDRLHVGPTTLSVLG